MTIDFNIKKIIDGKKEFQFAEYWTPHSYPKSIEEFIKIYFEGIRSRYQGNITLIQGMREVVITDFECLSVVEINRLFAELILNNTAYRIAQIGIITEAALSLYKSGKRNITIEKKIEILSKWELINLTENSEK